MNAGDSNDKNPETKAEMSGGLRDTALSGRGAGNDHGSPEQMAILRGMTPEQRWNAAHQLYWTMRRHKAAFLQSQHPDWSEEQIDGEVRRIFSNART